MRQRVPSEKGVRKPRRRRADYASSAARKLRRGTTNCYCPGGSNAGALLSGCGAFAPAPENVPLVEPLPPNPV